MVGITSVRLAARLARCNSFPGLTSKFSVTILTVHVLIYVLANSRSPRSTESAEKVLGKGMKNCLAWYLMGIWTFIELTKEDLSISPSFSKSTLTAVAFMSLPGFHAGELFLTQSSET